MIATRTEVVRVKRPGREGKQWEGPAERRV